MTTRLSLFASLLLLAGGAAPPVLAIDLAIPPNFPHAEIVNHQPGNTGVYIGASPTESTPTGWERPYIYAFDADGTLRWFRTEPYTNRIYINEVDDHILYVTKSLVRDERELRLIGSDLAVDTSYYGTNYVLFDDLKIDQHDSILDEDGNLYLLWLDPDTVDISDIVPGGDPDAAINHHVIQKRDPVGELLWEWRSEDHLDVFPYTIIEDTSAVLSGAFPHMHINSMQLLEDGDLLVNSRHMSCCFRIDMPSGEVEWVLGGGSNQFEFITDLPAPDNEPLRFSWGHDAQLHPDNHLTIYDNGKLHDPRLTYMKEYVLDTDAMTAELIWNLQYEDAYTGGAGSLQVLDTDNRFVGWGGFYRPHSASEVTPAGEDVWTADVYMQNVPDDNTAPTYRWFKVDDWPDAAEPYLCAEYRPSSSEALLIANWFGHEDETTAYEVYTGPGHDDLSLAGQTDDGFLTITHDPAGSMEFAQVIPVDGGGNPVGPSSRVFKVRAIYRDLLLLPDNAHGLTAGDTLRYLARFRMMYDDVVDLVFSQRLRYPDGSWTELSEVGDVRLFPQNRSELAAELAIPADAPEGEYLLEGHAVRENDGVLFDVTRLPLHVSSTGVSSRVSPERPSQFRLLPAYPNPFNPSTTLQVALPVPATLHMQVFNLAGRRVATLAQGLYAPGTHQFLFDATALASGVYLVRAEVAEGWSSQQKLLLLK